MRHINRISTKTAVFCCLFPFETKASVDDTVSSPAYFFAFGIAQISTTLLWILLVLQNSSRRSLETLPRGRTSVLCQSTLTGSKHLARTYDQVKVAGPLVLQRESCSHSWPVGHAGSYALMHDRKHLCHLGKARGRIELSMIERDLLVLLLVVRRRKTTLLPESGR